MAGKDCIAIATDLRFGIRNQTVGFNHSKVHQVADGIFIGLPGLISDAQLMMQKINFRVKLYELKEDRKLKISTLAGMVMSMLYEKRFGPYFVEPVIAGLDEESKPFLVGMDLIGAPCFTKDFITAGTAAEAIYGLAETLWTPEMDADQLFEVASQTLLNAISRDAVSGWGARVYLVTKDSVITRDLKARQD